MALAQLWRSLAVAIAVAFLLPTAGMAQSVCVTCERPAASYECVLTLPDGVSAPKSSKKIMQFACIEDIAKRYKHEQCAVRRGMVGPCIGERHALAIPGGLLKSEEKAAAPQSSAPQAKAQPEVRSQQARPKAPPEPRERPDDGQAPDTPQPAMAPAPKPADEKPPETMADMAKRAGEASQRQVEEVGDAVSGAVSKTWRCITSLFNKC